jgi:O-antigen/teichoic acid export membrane protein
MKNESAFYKTFFVVIILTLLQLLLVWLFVSKAWALSITLGSVTSLWAMSMLSKSSSKILKEIKDEASAKKAAAKQYAIRYAMYIIVLVVAGFSDNFEVVGVAIGLLLFKVVLYCLLFLEKRKVD